MVRDLEDFSEAKGRPAADYPDDYADDTADTDSWARDDYDDYDGDDYDDEEWAWPANRRWRPIALFFGAVVAVGAVATAVIINSGDSATTKATVGAPTPRSVISTTPRSPAAPSTPPSTARTPLPPETVTTLTPPSNAPTRIPTAAPVPTATPPGAALSPRTVVYTVTGTKQLFDLVNIAYTDARGFPVTEFNVALPWTKVVVLNPGVQTESVIATSIYGQLNCSIVNAQGQLVKASTNNSSIATCTR
ncbi:MULTISPECIES: MmpS family transport accessory protein [Mycobacterium]|nr:MULTISPECIES: MmpS family transport accessory protein [Mycobacterium]